MSIQKPYMSSFACFLLVFLFCAGGVANAQTVLTLAASTKIINTYKAFLKDKQQHPLEMTDLRSEHGIRAVAELIIIQQALNAAGMPVEIEFVETPNSARSLVMMHNGDVVMTGHTVFSTAVTANMYKGKTVIPKGRFLKGIYGLKQNKLLQRTKTLAELRKFRGVSSQSWTVDWLTMQNLYLDTLRHVPRYAMMVSLIANGKADFALLEFPSTDDLLIEYEGTVLAPIPGVTIALDDSRHFAVSKKHPDGSRVFEALEKGLEILRAQGLIKQYLTDVGFYNQTVQDWTLLNH